MRKLPPDFKHQHFMGSMPELVNKFSYVCVACRTVNKHRFGPLEEFVNAYGDTYVDRPVLCNSCGEPVFILGVKWRPPRKANDAAWKRIAAGEWNWKRNPRGSRWRPI